MLQPVQTNVRTPFIVAVAVIVAAAGLFAWYSHFMLRPSLQTSAPAAPGTATNLGGALYNKISNPVSGSLPKTLAPIPNPANSFYTNPFQR